MTGKLTAQLNGLFYGWRMVAAGCAMRMLGYIAIALVAGLLYASLRQPNLPA